MKKRVGLVGLGRHMEGRLYPTLEAMNLGHLTFGYDIDRGRQEIFGQAHRLKGIEPGELGRRIMDIDCLITALPPTESTEVLTECGKVGLPLYLEKPGLTSTSAFKTARKLLGSNHSKVSMGFNFRFAPAFLAARSRLEQGAAAPYLGTLRFLSRYPSSEEWGSRTPFEAWIRNNGVHALDLVNWLFGPPDQVQVTGFIWTNGRFLTSCALRWDSGSDIRLELGNATKAFQLALSVQSGARHRLHIDSLSACSLIDLETGLTNELFRDNDVVGNSKSGYDGSLREFLAQKRSSIRLGATFDDGENAMRLAERLLESAREFGFEMPQKSQTHSRLASSKVASRHAVRNMISPYAE